VDHQRRKARDIDKSLRITYLIEKLQRATVIADLICSQETLAAGSRCNGYLDGGSDDQQNLATPFRKRYNSNTEGGLILIQVDSL
jgi:hypothetical protein